MQLRDRNFNANVQLSDKKCQDQDRNALNRFMYIHKGTGDIKQDLTRDQRYGAFPTNVDEFGYRHKHELNEDIAENLPSEESRRAMQALKQRAVRNAENEVGSTILSQRDDKNQTAIELHDNRSKPEDFKHYAPSMRYRDDSPESKRQTIQKLNGLEKENIKPEDRKARQDQYN